MNIKEISSEKLIKGLVGELKKNEAIKAPEWASFVKTGRFKERPPYSDDWWHSRAASVLRRVKLTGPIGVSKLRTKYGGKKNRGVAPEKFYRGSGSIARKILQQLEKAGLLKQAQKGVHKGRVLTPKGQSMIDKVTIQIMKDTGTVPKRKRPSEKGHDAGKAEIPQKPLAKPRPAKKPEPVVIVE